MVRDTLSGNIEALSSPLRMQSALSQIPWLKPPRDRMLLTWLETMKLPNAHAAGAAGSEVSVNAPFDRLTWRVGNRSDWLVTQLITLMEMNELPPAEALHLRKAVAEFPDSVLAGWLRLRAGSQQFGWLLSGDLELEGALAHIAYSRRHDRFRDWAQRHQVDACVRLDHSPGNGNAFTALRFLLPGLHIDEQIRLSRDLHRWLQIDTLPQAVYDLLQDHGQGPLEMAIYFSAVGVGRVGLMAPKPDRDLVLLSCEAIHGSQVDAIAALERTLGADRPDYIEFELLGRHLDVELHYLLS